MILACSFFRLATMTDNAEYIKKVTKTITDLMRAAGMHVENVKPVRNTSFAHSKSYTVLIGCYDMFWSKFPDSKYNEAKDGISTSRFKDCSILGALDY